MSFSCWALNPCLFNMIKAFFMLCAVCVPAHTRVFTLPVCLCVSFLQHASQPRPGRTDTAEGGDGDTEEGERPTCPRAQPPKTEL